MDDRAMTIRLNLPLPFSNGQWLSAFTSSGPTMANHSPSRCRIEKNVNHPQRSSVASKRIVNLVQNIRRRLKVSKSRVQGEADAPSKKDVSNGRKAKYFDAKTVFGAASDATILVTTAS